MISASIITSASTASEYFLSEQDKEAATSAERNGAGEYYLGEQAPSVWQGAGAQMQGIDGQQVDKDALEKMLSGQVREIQDGQLVDKQLGRTGKDGQIEHKSGWDLTFSAPKSVSIEAEVFGKQDVKDAHEAAVHTTMKWLEEHGAGTRMGSDKEFQQTGNLTYAAFSHSTTREQDPQTHTHVLIQNLTYDKEGKAYSLESKGLYQLRATADQVYKNELANQLGKLGYQTEWDKKGFEIKGYSKEDLDVFSKRTDQINNYLEKQGIDPKTATAEQRQVATLATRPEKDFAESREAHYQKWEREAADHGITPAQRDAGSSPERWTAQEVVNKAVSSITEREAAFTTKQLWQEISRMNEGQASLKDLQATLKTTQERGDILQKRDGLNKEEQTRLKNPGKELWTTKDMQSTEKAMLGQVRDGKGATQAVMTGQQFDQFLGKYQEKMQAERGYKLNTEQTAAARTILTGKDRHSAVQGLAGTGKTTMLEFVREAAESRGWQVKGVSTGGNQAQKLEAESGIKSQTLTSYLASKDSKVESGSEGPHARSRLQDRGRINSPATGKPLDTVNAARQQRAAEMKTAGGRDAWLASKALETYKNEGNKLFGKMDQKKFAKLKDSVDMKKYTDSTGRKYFEDRKGNMYTQGLYNKAGKAGNTLEKKGWLSKTTYLKGDNGVILKQKSSNLRESLVKNANSRIEAKFQQRMAGHRSTDSRKPGLGNRLGAMAAKMDRGMERGVVKNLNRATGGGRWERVNGIEALSARVKMTLQTWGERRATLSELRQKAAGKPDADRPNQGSRDRQLEPQRGREPASAAGTARVLVIHDEASQAGSRDMNAFLTRVTNQGGKSVSLGDKHQFQSVAAGRAFEQMQSQGKIQTAELKDIRRQETQSLKETVQKVLQGKQEEALKSLPVVESRSAQDRVYQDARQKGIDLAGMSRAERGAWESKLKEAEARDNHAAIKQIAKDYTAKDAAGQKNTLILTATNEARKEINTEIHQRRIDTGQIEKGRQVEILSRIDRTEAQATRASSYEKGEMIRHGNQMYEVRGRDTVTNTLTLQKQGIETTATVKADTLSKATGFTKETREFSAGDKVSFYANDKSAGIRNGQAGTIKSISDDGKMTVQVGKTEKTVDLQSYKTLDHGYATTHYRAQGESVKNVMIHHDVRDGAKGNRSNYVSITRAKSEATVYTNNLTQAAKQVESTQDKRQALDEPRGQQPEQRVELHSKPQERDHGKETEERHGDDKNDHRERGGDQNVHHGQGDEKGAIADHSEGQSIGQEQASGIEEKENGQGENKGKEIGHDTSQGEVQDAGRVDSTESKDEGKGSASVRDADDVRDGNNKDEEKEDNKSHDEKKDEEKEREEEKEEELEEEKEQEEADFGR